MKTAEIVNSTSQKNETTWHVLREFETRDITSRRYKVRHSLELSVGKAREITSHFIQAREYFRSASEADFTVKPLLQYYGVASLSRGLTLFLDHGKREALLKPSHGLKIRDWGRELSSDPAKIGTLRIRVTNGLFHDLLLATKNEFYFRHNSSAVNWHFGDSILSPGSEFMLDEVTARIPDVADQYKAWTGITLPCVILKALHIDSENGSIKYSVSTKSQEEIDGVFPVEVFPSRSITKEGVFWQVECRRNEGSFYAQKIGAFGIGDIVLYRPLNSHSYFTPLAACFMLSFILSMLCRYFPTTWLNIRRTEKGDAFLPLAIRLLSWIEGSFPAMVVDVLKGPYDFESN